MTKMKAALVNTLGQAPEYGEFELNDPEPGEVRVKVIAAGLHTLVRTRATGAHYSVASNIKLPQIPGVDGVGSLPDGRLVYFLSLASKTGSFAEYVNVSQKACVPLPAGTDANRMAALMNPAMSSWLAARLRCKLPPKFTALILGVTGASGTLAMQMARYLGAEKVYGVGRNQAKLDERQKSGGLDAGFNLSDPDACAAAINKQVADVDVVFDYLSGPPAKLALEAIARGRTVSEKRLDWLQIGSMAGPYMEVATQALRGINVNICGSGIGTSPRNEFGKEIFTLTEIMAKSNFTYPFTALPLSKVKETWEANENDSRIVFTP